MRMLKILFALLFVAGFLAACDSDERKFNGPKSDCTSGLSTDQQQCGDEYDED